MVSMAEKDLDPACAAVTHWTLSRSPGQRGFAPASTFRWSPAPSRDNTALHDATIVEASRADAAPTGPAALGELVDVDFADDARAAALDLSSRRRRLRGRTCSSSPPGAR